MAVDSELPRYLEYAVLNFALSRFYGKLASNRAYYKRYATMVGQNNVSVQDLQDESDRYYQLFLDAIQEQTPLTPALFYDGP